MEAKALDYLTEKGDAAETRVGKCFYPYDTPDGP